MAGKRNLFAHHWLKIVLRRNNFRFVYKIKEKLATQILYP